MSFIDTPRFPDDIAFWASGGAGFNTSVITLNSGFEQRNVNWAASRGRWDISNGLRKPQDTAAVIAFFRAMQGKAHGFRFKDFNDYTATVAEGTFEATVITGLIRTVKKYQAGALFSTRRINKLTTVFNLYKSGVLQSFPSQYIYDVDQGFVQPVGFTTIGDYTWSGEFDVPVRFDTDYMQGEREAQGGFYVWQSIPIVELRVAN
jgi:uncharacterized protein (TIGR02217 family)